MHDHVIGAKVDTEESRSEAAEQLKAAMRSRRDAPIIAAEPAQLRPFEPPNPLAELLKGLPPGTMVSITLETKEAP